MDSIVYSSRKNKEKLVTLFSFGIFLEGIFFECIDFCQLNFRLFVFWERVREFFSFNFAHENKN